MCRRVSAIAGCLSVVAVALLLGGCVTLDQMDEMVQGKYRIEEQDLSPSALEKRMLEIDAQFAEPRTPMKVRYSLETAERSMSENNEYGALWRAMRACEWLARNASEYSERERHALKGVAMGKTAQTIEVLTTRPETYYYLALCRGAYCELKGTCSADIVRQMRDEMKMALALDESFDYCGGHRFLGKLILETVDVPGYAIGTVEEGLAYLREAAEKCPEFGENHLFLAEALHDEGQDDEARFVLQRLLALPVPPDHSAEHDGWLQRAAELLNETAVDDEVRVQAASADSDIATPQ